MFEYQKNLYFCTVFSKKGDKVLTRGVIGNTSDFGSGESRFEPWRVNQSSLGVHSLYVLLFCFLQIITDRAKSLSR